ncbi:MAG TPA: GntR family transcriptional regulator [Usitatibacteraceae bacterium]|nr:GntR family transcriptional regulator [Usitatibacteraceae bacterium]
MTAAKLLPATSAQGAADALEEDIVLGRLHPRQRITEDELLERFGLKRHVVREVLATLERMGLVERRRNIGALVRSFTPREVRELYAMRELLETEAARRMPLPPPAAALDRLAAIQRDHDKAVARRNLREVHRTNLAFHRELFALAGNEVLENAITEYARQTHAIRFSALVSPDFREQAREEHQAMIRALAAKDRVHLVALCRRHLRPARDAYLEHLAPDPGGGGLIART